MAIRHQARQAGHPLPLHPLRHAKSAGALTSETPRTEHGSPALKRCFAPLKAGICRPRVSMPEPRVVDFVAPVPYIAPLISGACDPLDVNSKCTKTEPRRLNGKLAIPALPPQR